jgi:hypothetical protein
MALIGAGVSIDAQLDSNLDRDEYAVHLVSGHVYDFWAGGDFTEGAGFIQNAELELTHGAGVVDAADGNSAEENNANIILTSTGGDFTLRVAEFTGAGTGGSYALTLVDKSVEDDISDHTFATNGGAGTIAGQGTNMVLNLEDVLVGTIERAADTDIIAIVVNNSFSYDFVVRAADTADGTLADAGIRILDADGTDITGQGTLNSAGSNASVTAFDPGAGGAQQFVFIEVTGHGGIGSYEVQVDLAGSAGVDDADVTAGAAPQAITNLPL